MGSGSCPSCFGREISERRRWPNGKSGRIVLKNSTRRTDCLHLCAGDMADDGRAASDAGGAVLASGSGSGLVGPFAEPAQRVRNFIRRAASAGQTMRNDLSRMRTDGEVDYIRAASQCDRLRHACRPPDSDAERARTQAGADRRDASLVRISRHVAGAG